MKSSSRHGEITKLSSSLPCHTRLALLTISMHTVPPFQARDTLEAAPVMPPKELRLRPRKILNDITRQDLKVNK